MKPLACLTIFILFGRVAYSYLVDPPTTAQNNTTSDCSTWAVVGSTDTCISLASENGISLAQFDTYNPSVGASCQLIIGDSYCVEENFGIPPPPTTIYSSSTQAIPTGISTPSPIQTGMVRNCSMFYLVAIGDQCGTIASSHGISLANFYQWNPAVESNCTSLIAGDYVCVEISGGTTLRTSTITNGIGTPTPIQTGMANNCNAFYLVQPGDQCGTVASSHGISLANFYQWNPAVGSNCTLLIAGDYVCVEISGEATLRTSTIANGISTPTPIQTGMANNCDAFYLVQPGDQCGTVASNYRISLADFYAWNPAVGNSCTTLFAGDYVCINILDDQTLPSTTSNNITITSKGNGVTAPTPIESPVL